VRTDIQPVSELVREAAAVCDPASADDAVTAFVIAFEDDDRPALGVEDFAGELRGTLEGIDPEGDSPAAAMTAALASFFATQPQHIEKPDPPLANAARAWFHRDPPEPVADWLRDHGADVPAR
jgi:hypothetical protein